MHEPITTLPDGTIKQVSPFNGTQVWTVPGRALRPLPTASAAVKPINWDERGYFCSFCERRYLDSPPEKERLVRDATRPTGYRTLRHVAASALADTSAEFRRVPNLFPILPLAYWKTNHGLRLTAEAEAWRAGYLAEPTGRAHLLAVARRLALAAGMDEDQWASLSGANQLAMTETFFGSCHDLIIGLRHFAEGAHTSRELASSGTLSPADHHAYLDAAIRAARELLVDNPFARYVTIFQNWLRPAGASFDHLHKQVAAIDQLPVRHEEELHRLHQNPALYRQYGVDYAERQQLVVASNEHAVAFAGYGHRYPTLEVHSLRPHGRPWDLSVHELRGLSELVRALHWASGADTPCNEEWHYQPPGIELRSPVRVVLKWRISTLAGFEGATKIYLNTVSPWTLRDRVLERLRAPDAPVEGLTLA